MNSTNELKVSIQKREKITPLVKLVEQILPLSNLDLLLPPARVGVFFCYNKNNIKTSNYGNKIWCFKQMTSCLKEALAQTLVHYFVFSSEIVHNSKGEAEIMCNNKGVEFVEAYVDVELCELNLYNPDESVEGKFMPKVAHNNGVFSVQATELKCGGLVLGCTFDHRVADAYSCNMFLVSWAEIADSKPISMMPCFTKSLLKARHPCSYDPLLDNMYIPLSSLITPTKDETMPTSENVVPLVSRIYHVSAKEINNIQSQAKGTKLESFSAFMWKLIAKHASISKDGTQDGSSELFCKMGIVVDGRTKLFNNNDQENHNNITTSRLSDCYFGNVISLPFGEKNTNDLVTNPLDLVAQDVHEFLKTTMNKTHFEDLIDWVETHRPEPCISKIYSRGRDNGPTIVVSSGQQFPVSKVDFGWGKPVFGSYYFPWNGNAGYIMPMPSSTRDGDWTVFMQLTPEQLEFIEKEAVHVFSRFKLSL